MSDNIVLISLTKDELMNLISEAVSKQLKAKQENELLIFRETCPLLNISLSSLNTWKATGKIPFRRIGKRVLFNRKDVLNSIKEDSHYTRLKELEG